jgi:hypothetical protein
MDGQANTKGCINILIFWVLGLIIIAFTGGNFRTSVPVVLIDDESVKTDTVITVSSTSHQWVGGMAAGKQPNISKYIAKYKDEGYNIIKIDVCTRHTWVDNLLMLVTVFIYCPMTIESKLYLSKKSIQKPK